MKHRRNIRGLAIGGGAVLAIAAGAIIGLSSHAQTARPNLTAAPATTAATSSGSASASAVYRPNFRPGPILLRKPQPPAQVLWSQATATAARLRQSRPVSTLVSRLPKAELDRTRLPVLLPREGGIIAADKARLFSFGDAYAMNLPQPKGTQITLYGNRSFVPAEAGTVSKRPFARLAGVPEDVRIDRTEDGWTATFTRYGVVYSIDVSCDDNASPDCASDDFLRKAIAQFDDVTLGRDATAEANGTFKAAPPPAAAKPDWLNQVFKSVTGGK